MSFKRPDDGEAFVLYAVWAQGTIQPLRFIWHATPGAEYIDQGFWTRDAWEHKRWCRLHIDDDAARRWDYVRMIIQLKGSNVTLYRRQLRDAQRIGRERVGHSIKATKSQLRELEKLRSQIDRLKMVTP